MLDQNNKVIRQQIELWKDSIRLHFDQSLKIIPADKLDWAPSPQMMRLGNIFLHVAETSLWWYGKVIKGETFTDLSDGAIPPRSEIKKHVIDHWLRLDQFFAEDPKILDQEFSFEGDGKTYKFTGFWIYTHLLEHDIHHRSQVNQYLRILGITPPSV